MKSSISVSTICIILLVCFPLKEIMSQAQSDYERRQEIINEITREKIRYPLVERSEELNQEAYQQKLKKKMTSESLDSLVMSTPNTAEAEVHAAINPNDSSNIVVSPIKTSSVGSSGLVCPVYYTKDFGKTWKKSSFVAQPADPSQTATGGGDPVLTFDTNGRCYLTWISVFGGLGNINFAMYWAYSDDGGKTWNRRDNDLIASGQGLNAVYDKQWIAIDRNANSSYTNNLYVVLYEVDQNAGTNQISVRKKPANVDTFLRQSVQITDTSFTQVQYSSIDVDNNGHIHVSFFGSKDDNNYALYHAVSTDGASSFKPYQKISNVIVPQFSGVVENKDVSGIDSDRFYPCPHIEVDNSDGPYAGNIYAVWNAMGTDQQNTQGLDIYFSKSTDNGNTWSSPVVLNQDSLPSRHQFYPNIDVNQKGTVVVNWYDRRHDPSNISTHHYMAHSVDGGATFNSQVVTSAPTDFSTVGLQNTNQGIQGVDTFGIGEYTAVVTSSSFAIPVWTDGRNNDGFLNIYAGFVPISNPRPSSANIRVSSVTPGFEVKGPYPNPASQQTTLDIKLSNKSELRIAVFNTEGKQVLTEDTGELQKGQHSLSLQTDKLPQGNYYCLIKSDKGTKTKPFTIIKD